MATLTDTQLIMLSKAAAWLGRAPFARIFEAMSHSAETFDCRSTVLSSRQRTPGKPLNRRYSGKAVESLEQGQHDCMRGAEDPRRSNRLR